MNELSATQLDLIAGEDISKQLRNHLKNEIAGLERRKKLLRACGCLNWEHSNGALPPGSSWLDMNFAVIVEVFLFYNLGGAFRYYSFHAT